MRLKTSALEKDVNACITPQGKLRSHHAEGGDKGWFLITGGLGGLGLHAAAGLVRHGARRLILTSRQGIVADAYKPIFHALSAHPSVEICVKASDASDPDSVNRLFDEAPGGIRGIIHCAGALSDGRLSTQNADKLRVAWKGKVEGRCIVNIR